MLEGSLSLLALLLFIKVVMGILKGLRIRMLLKACDVAHEHGVPNNFATDMIAPNNYEILKLARNTIASQRPQYRMLDVYEQYGIAIAYIYQEESDVKP